MLATHRLNMQKKLTKRRDAVRGLPVVHSKQTSHILGEFHSIARLFQSVALRESANGLSSA